MADDAKWINGQRRQEVKVLYNFVGEEFEWFQAQLFMLVLPTNEDIVRDDYTS